MRISKVALVEVIACCLLASNAASQSPACQPVVSNLKVVVTAEKRHDAGAIAEPPITDAQFGFAWPDTPLGALKTDSRLEFFASDGAHHTANNKYGSITRTIGTLDHPAGLAPPIDVSISPNPDPSVNPNYGAYTYLGGARVYSVPANTPGAGNLIAVYHSEIDTASSIYSSLGLALSSDNGLSWIDLGEIARLNQPYAYDLAGFDIGSPPLITSPDGAYFYVYFPDWIANGSLTPTQVTLVSVARASISSVLQAASSAPPHAALFSKYYQGSWSQPGLGGLSTDLNPNAAYSGLPNVAYNAGLGRYIMITDNTQDVAYAESSDGLVWTLPILLLQNPNSTLTYSIPLGMGDDPNVLAKQFFVFFTHRSTQGWPVSSVKRFVVTCQ